MSVMLIVFLIFFERRSIEMTIRYASRLLREIRDEWHKPIRSKRLMESVVKVSAYQRWAFDEIYIFMISHPSGDPIIAVQDLVDLADEAASNAKTNDVSLIFSTLCDISVEALDVFRLMEVNDM